MHLLCCRPIPDQFDQVVSQHDIAGRRCEVLTDGVDAFPAWMIRDQPVGTAKALPCNWISPMPFTGSNCRIRCCQSQADVRLNAYTIVERLEGHGDNAAPAVFGGLHIIVDSENHRIKADFPGEMMLWVPTDSMTSTDENRATMATSISRSDAIHNLGRIGLLVASLYENDIDLLRKATEDRMHQPDRFLQQPASKAAYDAALDAGAAAAWLSGSGPAVAIVAHPGTTETVKAGLPGGADVLHVKTDNAGTVIV